MTLREQRVLFTSLLPLLIQEAQRQGYEVALDFTKRCTECPVGKALSYHKLGLAADLLLYSDLDQDGRKDDYIKDTERHRQLGEFWEGLHPLCTWGGRWSDGNHYSLGEGKPFTGRITG